MTIAAGEPPRRAFSPILLLQDTRYRGLTIQFLALAILAMTVWFFVAAGSPLPNQ